MQYCIVHSYSDNTKLLREVLHLLYCNAKEKVSLLVPIDTTTHIPDRILQYRSVAVLENTCTIKTIQHCI